MHTSLTCAKYAQLGETHLNRVGTIAAIIYSFIATCRLQNIDPAKWLEDVFYLIIKYGFGWRLTAQL